MFRTYFVIVDANSFYTRYAHCKCQPALYIDGRQLEIKQGWIYNYFMFLDADIFIEAGNIMNFLSNLRNWQPAVGIPAIVNLNRDGSSVVSLNRAHLTFVAYHREALENIFHCIYVFISLKLLYFLPFIRITLFPSPPSP